MNDGLERKSTKHGLIFVDVLEGFVWYVVSAGVAQRCPLGKAASIGHAGQAASCRCQRMDVIMMWYLLPALGGRFPRNIQRHQNEPAAITFQACEDPQDDLERAIPQVDWQECSSSGL